MENRCVGCIMFWVYIIAKHSRDKPLQKNILPCKQTRSHLWDSTCTGHILCFYAIIVSLHEVIRTFPHKIEMFPIKCKIMRIPNSSTTSTTVYLCAWPKSTNTSAAKTKKFCWTNPQQEHWWTCQKQRQL